MSDSSQSPLCRECGHERQRIHRALLLLEMIEDDDGTMLRPVSHWLFALDAASKEMGTRL